MKKRNIIAFCVALVLVCNFLGVSQSGAWFVSGGSFSDNSYHTAQVVYLPALQTEEIYNAGIPKYGRLLAGSSTSTDDGGTDNIVYLVPGESMISSGVISGETQAQYPPVLSLENFSTVPTNVQVRIDVDFDNQNYDADGTPIEGEGASDPVTAEGMFLWKQIDMTDTYEYGVNYPAEGSGSAAPTFMPLLRVTFAKVIGATTVFPKIGEYSSNRTSDYSWAFQEKNAATTYDGWNLTLSGAHPTIIPQLASGTQQFYNVITDFEVVANVAEGATPEAQAAFDTFFSEHYAGHKIKIHVKYYAKQIAESAGWELFNETEISTQLQKSREQASF